jgi:hypothetical protein
VRLLIRPEIYDVMDDTLVEVTATSEWDRLVKNVPMQNIAISSNALAAPAGDPSASKILLSTATGGVPPIFAGMWGAST